MLTTLFSAITALFIGSAWQVQELSRLLQTPRLS
jgi:hypothetical protein